MTIVFTVRVKSAVAIVFGVMFALVWTVLLSILYFDRLQVFLARFRTKIRLFVLGAFILALFPSISMSLYIDGAERRLRGVSVEQIKHMRKILDDVEGHLQEGQELAKSMHQYTVEQIRQYTDLMLGIDEASDLAREQSAQYGKILSLTQATSEGNQRIVMYALSSATLVNEVLQLLCKQDDECPDDFMVRLIEFGEELSVYEMEIETVIQGEGGDEG